MPQEIILPPKYYLDYFRFLLEFVQRLYGHILNDDERQFIEIFDQLSEDAQCLFVRFSNRSGLFFRTNKIKYEEITDIQDAINELKFNGLLEELDDIHASYIDEILNLFTKEEWLKMAPPSELSLRSLTKPNLIRSLKSTFHFKDLISGLDLLEPVVKVCAEVEVMMFKFLFFGNRHATMTEFVVRDLGKINFEQYKDDSYTARFNNRAEADQKLMVSLTNETFYEKQQSATPPEDIYLWFVSWNASLPALSEVAQPSYDRLVCKIALYLERQKLSEQALDVYQFTDKIPSRERRARLLLRLGMIDEAKALCEAMATEPQNADERFFAIDFEQKLATKKRTKKSVTQFLHDAESVTVSIDYRRRVEQGVSDYFVERGYQAVHSENYPWRGLFGLVFWDIIYDTNVQAIHHPLQRSPSDFYLPDFYFKRQTQIKQRLEELDTTERFLENIETTFIQKFGVANVMVDWHEVLIGLCQIIVKNLTVRQLNVILLEMAQNLRENTHGFPDLMVWNDNGMELIEVKSPTDHLSAQQLYWLQLFKREDIAARVLRVDWGEAEAEK
jgi:VRR-NUC domain